MVTVAQVQEAAGGVLAIPLPAGDTEPATRSVTGITHDSRAVRSGDVFCCVAGHTADGHDYAPGAVARGAVALLCSRVLDVPVPQILVDDVRAAMGPAAAEVWGHPSDDLAVVGVTGTNGKTTTVHFLRAVLAAHGWPTGIIGTLTGVRTTPEATDLQAVLARYRDDGCRAVAMEVSSHALSLRRVDATRFAVAVFTMLGQDHLDYHGSMEEYFAAKARLFTRSLAERAVVNLDDLYGLRLFERAEVPTVGFRLADAVDAEIGADASRFTWRGVRIEVPIGGRFNVANALAAATAAAELGVSPSVVADGIRAAGPVPGRFSPVVAGQPFRVVVDYAHTPDGVEQLLRSAAEVTPGGRVLLVFGCGGERDATKRPRMGAVAAELADVVVLTSDNPRSEDPAVIAAQVRAGFPAGYEAIEEPDRRRAIAAALRSAQPGDTVVIAGKGHESVQEVRGARLPFDDRAVAAEELARLGHSLERPRGGA